MSNNEGVDILIQTAANNFEEWTGEFTVEHAAIFTVAGLIDLREFGQAVHDRSRELGKFLNFTFEDRGDGLIRVAWHPADVRNA